MKKIVIGIISVIVIACVVVFCITRGLIKNEDINDTDVNGDDISIEEISDKENDEIRFGRLEEKLIDGLEVEIDKGYETIDDKYTQDELKKMYENEEYIEDIIYRAKCDMDSDGTIDTVEVLVKMKVKYNDMAPDRYNVIGYDGAIEECTIKINDTIKLLGGMNPIDNIEIIRESSINKLKFRSLYKRPFNFYYLSYKDNVIIEEIDWWSGEYSLVGGYLEYNDENNSIIITDCYGLYGANSERGKFNFNNNVLVIPNELNAVLIKNGAFDKCKSKYIVVPSTVKKIESGGIPQNIKIIAEKGTYAEKYAKDNGVLATVSDVMESGYNIENGIIKGQEKAGKIAITSIIGKDGDYTNKLLNIPDKIIGCEVAEIKKGTFSNCKAEYVVIPDTVQKIEENVFPAKMKIIAPVGSYAEKYAIDHKLNASVCANFEWEVGRGWTKSIKAGGIDSVVIDWGDGEYTLCDGSFSTEEMKESSHYYENKGIYKVNIIGDLDCLKCDGCKIKKLKINRRIALLSCRNNLLQEIEVDSGFVSLDCSNNLLKEIDVKNSFIFLNCSNNQLNKLDFGDLSEHELSIISELNCGNNDLEYLDISKMSNLTKLECNGNENLKVNATWEQRYFFEKSKWDEMFPEHYPKYYFSQINDNYFTEWEMLEIGCFEVGQQFSANLYKDNVYSVVMNKVSDDDEYELVVNNKSIKDDSFLVVRVYVVDLNKNDEFKEIVIEDSGPSDDYSYTLYRYNGEEIIELGVVSPGIFNWYVDAETGIIVDQGDSILFLPNNTVLGYYIISNNELNYIKFNEDDIIGKEFIIDEERIVNFYESDNWDWPGDMWSGEYNIELKVGDRVKLLERLSEGYVFKVQINDKVGYIYYWDGD